MAGSIASSVIASPVGSQTTGSILTRALAGARKVFFTEADVAQPSRLYQVLYQLQQNITNVIRPLASNPMLGGTYFPSVPFSANVAQTFQHGVPGGVPVAWSATSPRPSGATAAAAVRVIETAQDPSNGLITLLANETGLYDVQFVPRPGQSSAAPTTGPSSIVAPSSGSSILRGTFSERPAAGTSGRMYLCTDVPFAYYDDGSAWNQHGVFANLPAPGAPSAFTTINVGSTEAAVAVGDALFLSTTDTSDHAHLWLRGSVTNGGPWTITAAIAPLAMMQATYPAVHLVALDSSNLYFIDIACVSNGTTLQLNVEHWSSATNRYAAPAYAEAPWASAGAILWLQLHCDGTNTTYRYSNNGVEFFTVYSEGKTAFCNPNTYGVSVSGWGATCWAMVMSLTAENA